MQNFPQIQAIGFDLGKLLRNPAQGKKKYVVRRKETVESINGRSKQSARMRLNDYQFQASFPISL